MLIKSFYCILLPYPTVTVPQCQFKTDPLPSKENGFLKYIRDHPGYADEIG